VQLCLNDSINTPIAQFYPKKSQRFGISGDPAYLEIYPIGEWILDYIIVTFIFIQKMCDAEGGGEGGDGSEARDDIGDQREDVDDGGNNGGYWDGGESGRGW
jgi:hypothetical protein